MWTKRNDHALKNECVVFLLYAFKIYFWPKNGGKKQQQQVWPFSCFIFTSLLFTFPIFLFLFVLTLNFRKYDYNEGEKEETYFALRIIHVLVHACKACCRHSQSKCTSYYKENRHESLRCLSIILNLDLRVRISLGPTNVICDFSNNTFICEVFGIKLPLSWLNRDFENLCLKSPKFR